MATSSPTIQPTPTRSAPSTASEARPARKATSTTSTVAAKEKSTAGGTSSMIAAHMSA